MDNTALEQEFRQLVDTIYTPETMDDNRSFELAIQFIDDHEEFVKQDRRYLEFNGMLVLFQPCVFPRYYVLLDKLMGLANATNDMQALTDIAKCLELLYAPANVPIMKNIISILLNHKAYQNAAELCEYLESNKQFRDTYHPHVNSAL